jgi:hypothetical protein
VQLSSPPGRRVPMQPHRAVHWFVRYEFFKDELWFGRNLFLVVQGSDAQFFFQQLEAQLFLFDKRRAGLLGRVVSLNLSFLFFVFKIKTGVN